MKNKTLKLLVVLMVIIMAVSVFAACKKEDTPVETEAPQATEAAEATPEPVMTDPGALLDSITMIGVTEESAVTQLEAGEIDIYAGALPGKYKSEIEEAGLESVFLGGTYYEITTNNAVTNEGFNPFSIREFRVAMNKMVDREYICSEIFDGAALPRYFVVGAKSPDYARYVEYARAAEAEMAYDKEAATAMIEAAMADAGIEKNADGKYVYDGEPITLTFLIRTEDGVRQNMGDYIANEMEEIGFTIDRQYKTSSECWALWGATDPKEGQWHMYTGGWGASGLARDTGIYWHDFLSPDSRYGLDVFMVFEIAEEDNDILEAVAYNKYTSMEEREELFAKLFELEAYYAQHIWLCDSLAYTPWDTDVSTSYNLAAGVDNNNLTPYTIQFNDREGGDMVWANSSPPFVNPVNPIAGTNYTYDSQYLNFTRDYPFMEDPYTGLNYPKRVEKAEVVIETGLPVGKTYDWIDLSFEDEIVVPNDAMIDWDIETETWILADADYFAGKVADAEAAVVAAEEAVVAAQTAAEAGPQDDETTQADLDAAVTAAEAAVVTAGEAVTAAQELADQGYLTAKSKVVYYYGEDLSDYTWHDGTPISLADIMMGQIMGFATAYEGSPVYDKYVAPSFLSSLDLYKGWRIVSEDPIIIESYSDSYALDAENNVSNLALNWTYDSTGAQASWYAVAAGNKAVMTGLASYSEGATSDNDAVEWLNYIDGPSLELLKDAFTEAAADSYIPFEATMGAYVTADEATAAYEASLAFYEANGHFAIGCGPYYISHVMSTEGSITLTAYEDYQEDKNRWSFLSLPKMATVEVDGPASVTADAEAVFEVYVEDPDGEAYPADEIQTVKYLLFDSTGAIADVVELDATEDGLYEVVLTTDTIAALGEGACKVEVVVSPKSVVSPAIVPAEFVVE